MSGASASTDSHSRWLIVYGSLGSGMNDCVTRWNMSASDNLLFPSFKKPLVKKQRGHVERVLRRMGR